MLKNNPEFFLDFLKA